MISVNARWIATALRGKPGMDAFLHSIGIGRSYSGLLYQPNIKIRLETTC